MSQDEHNITTPSTSPDRAEERPALTAYRLHSKPHMPIVQAHASRDWIDATREQFARRCLPLLIANQAGWYILTSHSLRVTWNGGDEITDLQLEWLDGNEPYPAVSHFGHGILTWTLPYLFRTSPGYQLLARGPANWPKDGICALEGMVETDWSVATFTMNWILTAVDHPVEFEAGEPICMIVPQRYDSLEAFQPELRDLETDPHVQEAHAEWSDSRRQYLVDLNIPGSPAARQGWQKDYFRGQTLSGEKAPEHRTKLRLSPFEPRDP